MGKLEHHVLVWILGVCVAFLLAHSVIHTLDENVLEISQLD